MILFAPFLMATATPDYLGYMERLKPYAEMVVSVPLCEPLGFKYDTQKLEKIGRELGEEAVKDGMDVDSALRFYSSALRQERERMEFLLSQVDKDDSESVEEFLDYLEPLCLNAFRNYHTDGAITLAE